jgi:hypothetical protein
MINKQKWFVSQITRTRNGVASCVRWPGVDASGMTRDADDVRIDNAIDSLLMHAALFL